MPSGDFTNPRYQNENRTATNSDLYKKYGYVPRVNSDDYDCKCDYQSTLNDAKQYGYNENDWK